MVSALWFFPPHPSTLPLFVKLWSLRPDLVHRPGLLVTDPRAKCSNRIWLLVGWLVGCFESLPEIIVNSDEVLRINTEKLLVHQFSRW